MRCSLGARPPPSRPGRSASAAQILLAEQYRNLDPSHPLGGPDGARDAIAERDGKRWVMAAYFPRGQQTYREIEKKFLTDLVGVGKNGADGIAFVTNQELTLTRRLERTPTIRMPYGAWRAVMTCTDSTHAKIASSFQGDDA